MKIIGISEPAIQKIDAEPVPSSRLRLVSESGQNRTEHFLATFVLTFDPETVPKTELTCQTRLEVAIPARGTNLTYLDLEHAARAELAPLLRALADAVDSSG